MTKEKTDEIFEVRAGRMISKGGKPFVYLGRSSHYASDPVQVDVLVHIIAALLNNREMLEKVATPEQLRSFDRNYVR